MSRSAPAVAYTYAPGRGGVHAVKLLDGFSGVLQVDGYAVYDQLARRTRAGGGSVPPHGRRPSRSWRR